ncbi:hypothetical protein FUAX_51510 (plasmid) [Fulvitalea axinellae]|uniref:Carboxymuconolactone decarboxylase-like domain-containing protein n=1 Tax=Fulvitalea axinellae TaxID=1182444 RepID=A0AAU9CL57_9BACT|nr:hypothetical protein FUAX_51510 [Fulvitalea axinellae]
METRIQIENVEPKAYEGMFALENYLKESGLSETHKELIKLRASQINGCTFCIDMHAKQALENGEEQRRLFLLSSWRDIALFSEEEKIILQMTEEITMIHSKGLIDKTYQGAIEVFGSKYFSHIVMAIATINAWNRIAISTRKPI